MNRAANTGLLLRAVGLCLLVLFLPTIAMAATGGALEFVDLAGHWAGILSLVIFVAAYSLVIGEEVIHLRKSKPVIVAAGLIWVLRRVPMGRCRSSSAWSRGLRRNARNSCQSKKRSISRSPMRAVKLTLVSRPRVWPPHAGKR